MIRLQMQQLTEENQQLNNKISILQNQQDRLYQDLANKIQELQENLKKNSQSPLSISKDKINKIEDISRIENKEKQVENKKKLKDIIPPEENELDLAKKYTIITLKRNCRNTNKKPK